MSIVDEMKEQIKLEGIKEGDRAFNERLIALKVERCQEIKNTSCSACPHLDWCGIAQEFRKIQLSRIAQKKGSGK